MGLFLCYIAITDQAEKLRGQPVPDPTNVLLFLDQRKSDPGRARHWREESETCYGKGGEFREGQRFIQ